MYEEKRKYPRVHTDVKLYLQSTEFGSFYATAKDISAKGITLESEKKLPDQSEFEIELDLEGPEDILKARGRVLRSWEEDGKHLAGVELLGMDPMDFLDLLDFTLSKTQEE